MCHVPKENISPLFVGVGQLAMVSVCHVSAPRLASLSFCLQPNNNSTSNHLEKLSWVREVSWLQFGWTTIGKFYIVKVINW